MELSSPTRSIDDVITVPSQTRSPAKTEPCPTRSTRSTQSHYSITNLPEPPESSPARSNSVKPNLLEGSDEVKKKSEVVNEGGQTRSTRSTKLQLNSCIDKLLEGSDEEKKSEEVNELCQTRSCIDKLLEGSNEEKKSEEVNEVGQTRSTRSTQSPYSIMKRMSNSCIGKLLEGSNEEKKSEEVNELCQTRSCIDKLLEGSNEENNYSEVGDCSTEEFVLRYYKVYEFDSCVAEVPSEGGICGACGEGKGEVVVCDGCEGGFHVECVGVMKGEVDEWMCRECEKKRRKGRKRKGGDLWSFGVKSKRRKRIHVPRGGGIR